MLLSFWQILSKKLLPKPQTMTSLTMDVVTKQRAHSNCLPFLRVLSNLLFVLMMNSSNLPSQCLP